MSDLPQTETKEANNLDCSQAEAITASMEKLLKAVEEVLRCRTPVTWRADLFIQIDQLEIQYADFRAQLWRASNGR